MALTLCLTAFLTAVEPPSSRADEPYAIKICLRFSDDPTFTPVFKESVSWQVRDQLRNFFGPLANVELIDGHPVLDLLRDDRPSDVPYPPAEQIVEPLDGKLFAFDIDYDDGQYQVGWRQLDGDVLQVGPPRRRATSDRPWLAKSICLAVKEDFAPVALVKPGGDSLTVQLEFRGSRTAGAERLIHWLGDDCVLQAFWVVRGRDRTTRQTVPFTVLRMSRAGGMGLAQVETNISKRWSQPSARVLGVQAIRIHTQRGRVRLKLVDRETGGVAHGCQVLASDRGFDKLDDSAPLSADAEGYVVTPKPLAHVGYFKVLQGGGAALQFPLPLVGDWQEEEVRISVDPQARQRSDLKRQLGYLGNDARALRMAKNAYYVRIDGFKTEKQYENALRECETALEFMKRYVPAFRDGLLEAQKSDEALSGLFAPRVNNLLEKETEIIGDQQGLQTLADNLRQVIADNNARTRSNEIVEAGAKAVREGDGDLAIAKYEQALAEWSERPLLKAELATLKEVWRIKNPRHQQARDFVMKDWTQCEVTDLEERFPDAEQAMQTLTGVGDWLTLKRLQLVSQELQDDLSELFDDFGDRADEADEANIAEQEKYQALTERLAEFIERIGEEARKANLAKNPAPGDAGEKAPPAAEEEE